jgi:hypothetical protein
MKYFVRALKYLIYFFIIFLIIVGVIWILTIKKTEGLSFIELFREGSLPQMGIFFVAVAAIYPALGFVKRKMYTNKDFPAYIDLVKEIMTAMEYELEKEEDNKMSFRMTRAGYRISRMWEDRVTFDWSDSPTTVDGLRKDVDRIVRNIDFKIREAEREERGGSEE